MTKQELKMSFINFSEYQPDYYSAMSRRLPGNVMKLEVNFGADRQTIMIRRNQDLTVRDIMEEVEKTYRIPIHEQVIFHKGNNLTEYIDVKLEQLGVENNHPIRVNRDPELMNRSPRLNMMNGQQMMNAAPPAMNQQQQLDSQSYLKEIAPNRVPDPTPYQVQLYNQQMMGNQQNISVKPEGPQDILKLNIAYGSERETILINGKRPLKIADLKRVLHNTFKIPPEQQCIVFKGSSIHDYMDEAPLSSFGLENNSPVSVWPRANNTHPDIRLPRAPDQLPTMQLAEAYSTTTPRLHPGPVTAPRWSGGHGKTVKVEVEHGSDRHQVIMYEYDKPLTVLDMENELERMIHVPVKDQRIFFKSKEISQNPFMTLFDCEIENNSTVKLVGDANPAVKYANFFTTRPNQQNASQPPMQQGGFPQGTPRNNHIQQNPQLSYRQY